MSKIILWLLLLSVAELKKRQKKNRRIQKKINDSRLWDFRISRTLSHIKCRKHPSKHLLVFKTSSTRLQRNNFTSSKTSWRRLDDVFKTSPKTSSRRLGRRKIVNAEDVFKTSWRHILRTSSRCLGGKQNFYWWYLYLTNLNVYLTNLRFTNLYLKNLRRIQNASLRTQ